MGLNLKFCCDGVEILSSVPDDEAKHKRILEGEKNHDVQTFSSPTSSGAKRNEAEGEKSLRQEENKHRNDFVTKSPQIISLTGGKDNNWNNATENKGTGLFTNHL